MFFFPGRDAGEIPLDKKSGNVLAIHFRKDREQLRPRSIRNPHLGPIEQVMLAVRRKRRFRAHPQRVGTGSGFT